MRIRKHILLVTIGPLVLVTAGLTALLYQVQRRAYASGVDRELYTAALMAHDLLPAGYHDRIDGPDSVSPAEYERIVDRFNRICSDANLKYLWSLMELEGRVVFTSATSPSKHVSRHDQAGFLDVHTNPELYTKAFQTMQPQYQVNADKWGRIRAVLVPFRDSRGRKYLMGASRSMKEIDAHVQWTLLWSLLVGLGALAAGSVPCVLLANSLSRPVEAVTAAAAGIAEGRLSQQMSVGGPAEMRQLCRSINAMSRVIRERIEDLAASRERLQVTLCSIGDAVIATDAAGRIDWMNQVAEKLTGWAPAQAQGRPLPDVFRIIDARTRKPMEDRLAVVRRLETVVTLDDRVILIARDGREIEVADSAAPIRDGAGVVTGVVVVFRDVTADRRRDQALREREEHYRQLAESNRLLLSEVNHRVRNNLASLLALVALAQVQANGVDEFAQTVEQRIWAMACVHTLLAGKGWRSIQLGDLIRSLLEEMRPLAPHAIAVRVDGPEVKLSPRQCLPLTLSLAELLTNSHKHGAHRSPSGRLSITWRRQGENGSSRVQLRWRETAGTLGLPGPASLGTRLVGEFIRRDLGGRCEMNYDLEGADHLIEFPA